MTTSNFDLDELGKGLIPCYRPAVSKDQLKDLTPNEKEFIIVNTANSTDKGVFHWQLIYRNGDEKIFYCTYGSLPSLEIIEYLNNEYKSTLPAWSGKRRAGNWDWSLRTVSSRWSAGFTTRRARTC